MIGSNVLSCGVCNLTFDMSKCDVMYHNQDKLYG